MIDRFLTVISMSNSTLVYIYKESKDIEVIEFQEIDLVDELKDLKEKITGKFYDSVDLLL